MRYFLSFVIGIGLIVLVFVWILRSFSGTDAPVSTPRPLVSYANTATAVQMIVDSPITADQTHHRAEITLDQSQNSVAIIQGYENNVIRSQSYPSNTKAYASFLRSLDLAGYNRGDPNPDLKDERGHCPRGTRYIFRIFEGSREIQRFWSTSCGQGNFRGNTNVVRSLFVAAVPDYNKLIRDTRL